MGQVDYISRQPNQEAKDTNKNDEEFAVAKITRIVDAIAANYIKTTPQMCQSQHFSSVSHTHSTRASNPQPTNHSNLLSALDRHTTQLLLTNSANAGHFHQHDNSDMSSSKTNPQIPPTPATSRVKFQSTPNSAVNSTRSSNEGPASPNLELSKKEVFENNLIQLFTG